MGRIWNKMKRGFRAIGRGLKKAGQFLWKNKESIANTVKTGADVYKTVKGK
jgi:hypothetical protein